MGSSLKGGGGLHVLLCDTAQSWNKYHSSYSIHSYNWAICQRMQPDTSFLKLIPRMKSVTCTMCIVYHWLNFFAYHPCVSGLLPRNICSIRSLRFIMRDYTIYMYQINTRTTCVYSYTIISNVYIRKICWNAWIGKSWRYVGTWRFDRGQTPRQ